MSETPVAFPYTASINEPQTVALPLPAGIEVPKPSISSITPTEITIGDDSTTLLTATGTGFNRQSVIWSNGIAYPTTFVSATSLTCTAPKRPTAGTYPVKVVTGGAVETATVNWTFT